MVLRGLVDLNARHGHRFGELPSTEKPGPAPTTARGELGRAGEELLLAALPDKAVLKAVDGWKSHPDNTAKALGAAFLGMIGGGVADGVELAIGTTAGLVRLARAAVRAGGVKLGSAPTNAVTSELAAKLSGHESPSSARLSRHPDVQGDLQGRPVSVSFPDGGLPWRAQGKRVKVSIEVPGAKNARIRRDRADVDLLKAGVSPEIVKAKQFWPVQVFDRAGSDLVVKNGRAEIEMVLPGKVDDLGADGVAKSLGYLGQLVDQLAPQ